MFDISCVFYIKYEPVSLRLLVLEPYVILCDHFKLLFIMRIVAVHNFMCKWHVFFFMAYLAREKYFISQTSMVILINPSSNLLHSIKQNNLVSSQNISVLNSHHICERTQEVIKI